MLSSPLLWGFLLLVCLFCGAQTQDSNHETHQVYSYTYHFQHNGTTDPKKLVQSVLAQPPQERGAVVKSFWNPDVRGFVSQGFFPVQPPNLRFNARPKPPTFEGIKKLVEENLKQVPNPTPPELIKVPPHVQNTIRNIDEKVNRRLSNLNNRLDNLDLGPRAFQGPGDGILNLGRHQNNHQPHVNNGVVTNVKTFEKDLPNGKIFERIETFSFNPEPVRNSIDGPHQNQQVFNHNQRAFGRTVSYFRKEHRTDAGPLNQIVGDFPTNDARNIHQNLVHGNNGGFNTNNNFNNNNNHQHRNDDHAINNLVRDLKEVRSNLHNGFGSRLNNIQNHNHRAFNNQQNPANPNAIHQNRNNNNNNNNGNFHHASNFNNPHNRNFHNSDRPNVGHNRNFHQNNQVNQNVNNNNNQFFHNSRHQRTNRNNNNNRNFNNNIRENVPHANRNGFVPGHGNINNPANQVLNTLSQLSRNNLNSVEGHGNIDGRPGSNIHPFTWDDDNRGWRVDSNTDWSRRNSLGPGASRGLPNHGPQDNHNPVDALRSTLQSLTGNAFQIPNLNGNAGPDGHYNNFRGGGEERTFKVDSISEGPNSYQRNLQRRYDRNFSVNTNSGYQFNKRWSSGDLNKLGTSRKTRSPTFKKDFIDVFSEEDASL